MTNAWLLASLAVIASACATQGRGCGAGLAALPVEPAPLGIPASQVIEGGMQVRLTKAALDKMLVAPALPAAFCALPPTTISAGFVICDQPDCPGGALGCPGYSYTNSASRPATPTPSPPFPPAAGRSDDGKLRVQESVADGPNPTLAIDTAFDALVPVHVSFNQYGQSVSCYLYAYDAHLADDSADPMHAVSHIPLTVDPVTGALQFGNEPSVQNLNFSVTGCSALGGLVSAAASLVSTTLQASLTKLVIAAQKAPVDTWIAATLPTPAGVAGTLDLSTLLGSYQPPKSSSLELAMLVGGSVNAKSGGISLGVIAALNSDRDPLTRGKGLASEPSTCIAPLPLADLAAPPWSLQQNLRDRFELPPIGALAGDPEPMLGADVADVALGVSRKYLDLLGFHALNSGALCLSLTGTTLSSLTSGALSVLVDSSGDLYGDRRAPLTLSLRPTTPLAFKIGAGTTADPLLQVRANQLGVGFTGQVQGKAKQIYSATLDVELDFNLDFMPVADDIPGIEPLLVSVETENIVLGEVDPTVLRANTAALKAWSRAAAGVAAKLFASALTGPVTLPSLPGRVLDRLAVVAEHAPEDDFVIVKAMLAPSFPAASAPVPSVAIDSIAVPDETGLRALFGAAPIQGQKRPRISANFDPPGAEFSYRIDAGVWRAWASDTHPTLADDELLLQGHHGLDVRARSPGNWRSESTHPAHADFVIDSVPPELSPVVEAAELSLHGYDLVSDADKILYAWLDATGTQTPYVPNSLISFADISSATRNLSAPLVVFAKDEAGNILQVELDASALFGSSTGNVDDAGAAGAGDAGTSGNAGARGGLADASAASADSAGCGCKLTSAALPSPMHPFGLMVALLAMLMRRRRAKATSVFRAFFFERSRVSRVCGVAARPTR